MVGRPTSHGAEALLVAGDGLDGSGQADLVVHALGAVPGVPAVRRAGTTEQVHSWLAEQTFAAVVLDLAAPGATAPALLDLLRRTAHSTGLVLLPERPGEDVDRLSTALCADDVVLRDELSTRHLTRAVSAAVRRARASRENRLLRGRFAALSAASNEGLVIVSAGKVLESVNDVAARYLGVDGRRPRGLRLSRVPWTYVDADDHEVPARDFAALLELGASELASSGRLGVRTAAGVVTRVFLDVTLVDGSGDLVLSMRDSSAYLATEQVARFQAALLKGINQAVVVTDPEAHVVFWNPAAERLYGWSADEAVGRPVMEVTPRADPGSQASDIAHAVEQGASWGGDEVLLRRDGSEFQALVSVAPVYDEREQLVALVGVSSDISARKAAEQRARTLSAIVESMADAVLTHGLDGVVQTWNAGAERLLGWSAEEAVGAHVRDLFAGEQPAADVAVGLANLAADEVVHDHEVVGRRRDGSRVDLALTVSPVKDEHGAVVAASVIARDVSERRRLQEELHHQATHDRLTGLPNRALLEDRLAHTLAAAARSQAQVAVLFVDLDDFKIVNDAYGHLVGDALLGEVARRFTSVTRPSDTVARFGGDEFVVVCDDTDVAGAQLIAERIAEVCRPAIEVGELRLQVSTSIGIAVSPPVEADGGLLIRCADAALYQAKAGGRARWHVHGSEPTPFS